MSERCERGQVHTQFKQQQQQPPVKSNYSKMINNAFDMEQCFIFGITYAEARTPKFVIARRKEGEKLYMLETHNNE